jgi:DNA mismatch endonuclease (patch repair protein)
MMSGIRGKNTKPELIIRSGLHRRGYRFRLHSNRLPGRPDIVLPKYRAAIMVHGCFWHGHNCHLFKMPATRTEFWKNKITTNQQRDQDNRERLKTSGWRLLEIWECALKGKFALSRENLIERCVTWLEGGGSHLEIEGGSYVDR